MRNMATQLLENASLESFSVDLSLHTSIRGRALHAFRGKTIGRLAIKNAESAVKTSGTSMVRQGLQSKNFLHICLFVLRTTISELNS
jgi:hypothetical protein